VHQDRERVAVAAAGLFDEASIHVDLRGCRTAIGADYPL
jgi:hypothetical protein